MSDVEHLGRRFSEIRIQSGLTQNQMAEYLQVDQSYISRCEKNERQFSADVLEKAACLFGCCCCYLHGDVKEPVLHPLKMPVRDVSGADLESIATINRIAINLFFMEQHLKGADQ